MLVFSILCFILLFMYGINTLTIFLENNFTNNTTRFIDKTDNIYTAFLIGVLITFLTQSSSTITAIMIAFLNAKKIKLNKAMAVMLGSNIGTTFTSLLTSFNIDQYCYIILTIGLFLSFCKKTKGFSKLFLGLGFIFFSLFSLKNELYALFEQLDYIYYFQKANNSILLSTWNGVLISGIIQSSSVTIGLAQVSAQNNLISLLSGICIVLGANIGTTFTGLIASINSSNDSKVLSVAHLFINLFGVILVLPFINILLNVKVKNIPLYLSFVHIVFNIINCLLAMFFINPIITFSKFFIKKEPS